MKKIIASISAFVSSYPAILAAYFIYGYYFISTMDFYIAFKRKHLSATETVAHFDTLIWMWVLAWALVWVIELRERLHRRDRESIEQQNTIKMRETQLKTLHEVVLTLKHQINNPLAIILGYVRMARKKTEDQDLSKKLVEIETAAQRISTALKEYADMQSYQTQSSPVGDLVQLPSEKKPAAS